jgi:hypothetical protein
MITQIHNYYSDYLLAIKSLFDTIIFPRGFIKHFSFNVANRTFELSKYDYRPNRALPAMVVQLNLDEMPFGERPTNIIKSRLENINQIPVLYDSVTNKAIHVQEEHTNISVTISLNCESQFQAKEVEFVVKRFLPQNKYCNILDFTSFLEIDQEILFSLGMDFNDHPITNLFTKINKNIGLSEYCYSINYSPLIKLESIDTNIASSAQTTFTVSIALSLLTQIPLYLIYEDIKPIISKINVDFTRFGHEPISENSMRSFTLTDNYLILATAKKYVRRNLLIHDFEDFNLTNITVNNIEYKLFEIRFNIEDFEIKENFLFRLFDATNNIHDITPTLIDQEYIQSDIIKSVAKFQVTKQDFENYFEASITTPVVLQIIEDLS